MKLIIHLENNKNMKKIKLKIMKIVMQIIVLLTAKKAKFIKVK